MAVLVLGTLRSAAYSGRYPPGANRFGGGAGSFFVPVRDGVHQCFQHSGHVGLRLVDASDDLGCTPAHVLEDESTGLDDLLIQGPRDVCRV